ncbi:MULTISPECIES: hypothetical protein [Rhizobium]|uniref:hypothetical protein n=1 Tax=Rhizobium TaxID=379 RepID=UPI001484F31D|nr:MULTISPECIES: hypothetical protein [Rhizobium]WET72293.1 hypothetical protein PYR68_12360 [Rhizobium croatiense]
MCDEEIADNWPMSHFQAIRPLSAVNIEVCRLFVVQYRLEFAEAAICLNAIDPKFVKIAIVIAQVDCDLHFTATSAVNDTILAGRAGGFRKCFRPAYEQESISDPKCVFPGIFGIYHLRNGGEAAAYAEKYREYSMKHPSAVLDNDELSDGLFQLYGENPIGLT